MEKFCLRWNEFEFNVKDCFKKLREDQRIFDVTLATEDGQETKAHKIVLSAGSDFFSDIFSRNNHPNMYIFLKGVGQSQLEKITDFLYYGEASIAHDEMQLFFETSKLLQVKGLQGKVQDIGQTIQEELRPQYEYTINEEYENVYHGTKNNIVNQETIVESFNPLHGSVNETFEGGKIRIKANKELDHQIEEMVEKTEDGKWKCNICGKIATLKKQSKNHAETHIEGLSFFCDICNKACSTRQYLRQHKYDYHTGGVFSCNICDKTGMSRAVFREHNARLHRKSFGEKL